MRINFSTPISFNSLRMRQMHSMKFPEDFSCRSRDLTPYDVSIREAYDCYNVQIASGNLLEPEAEQEIMLRKCSDYMTVDNMFTEEKFRSGGLGICMHLTNIIELLENDLDRIELTAASSAVPFHTKCGFKPNVEWKYILTQNIIREIAKDNTEEFSEYSDIARLLLNSYLSNELKTKLANKTIYGYTKQAIKIKSKEEQKALFQFCIPMVLTRKDVLKNKKFYNKLFEKYHIDYKIQ